MHLAQGKNPTCFICLGIGILSNFAVVKSLHNIESCLVDNKVFCLWFYQSAMESFQINIIVVIVGSNKCNIVVIFCKTGIYVMLWMFSIK